MSTPEPTPLREICAHDSPSFQIAVAGYMADRHALTLQIEALRSDYDSCKTKGAFITQELIRIDKAVAELLALLDGQGARTP